MASICLNNAEKRILTPGGRRFRQLLQPVTVWSAGCPASHPGWLIWVTTPDVRLMTTWRVNLLTARLLAQSCAIWPDRERLDRVIALSGRLLAQLEEQQPVDYEIARPTPVPILDPGATPTPKPDASTSTSLDPDPETGSSGDSDDGMIEPPRKPYRPSVWHRSIYWQPGSSRPSTIAGWGFMNNGLPGSKAAAWAMTFRCMPGLWKSRPGRTNPLICRLRGLSLRFKPGKRSSPCCIWLKLANCVPRACYG